MGRQCFPLVGITSLMTQYPGYTTAVAAAAAAVTGLAGAAGLAALALGKGGLPGGMGLPSSGAGGPGKTGGKMGLLKGLGKAGGALGLIGLMGDLFFTSDADMAVLNAADAMRNSRGRGFTDPRIIGSGGAASAAALERSLRATAVKGEITVRVTAAPGISIETSVSSNSPRISTKALGQTNLRAGY